MQRRRAHASQVASRVVLEQAGDEQLQITDGCSASRTGSDHRRSWLLAQRLSCELLDGGMLSQIAMIASAPGAAAPKSSWMNWIAKSRLSFHATSTSFAARPARACIAAIGRRGPRALTDRGDLVVRGARDVVRPTSSTPSCDSGTRRRRAHVATVRRRADRRRRFFGGTPATHAGTARCSRRCALGLRAEARRRAIRERAADVGEPARDLRDQRARGVRARGRDTSRTARALRGRPSRSRRRLREQSASERAHPGCGGRTGLRAAVLAASRASRGAASARRRARAPRAGARSCRATSVGCRGRSSRARNSTATDADAGRSPSWQTEQDRDHSRGRALRDLVAKRPAAESVLPRLGPARSSGDEQRDHFSDRRPRGLVRVDHASTHACASGT